MTALGISILLIFDIVLATLFYFQYKRQEKIIERQLLISKWCETLMDNEKILSDDLKKLYHEFQAYKTKEDKRWTEKD